MFQSDSRHQDNEIPGLSKFAISSSDTTVSPSGPLTIRFLLNLSVGCLMSEPSKRGLLIVDAYAVRLWCQYPDVMQALRRLAGFMFLVFLRIHESVLIVVCIYGGAALERQCELEIDFRQNWSIADPYQAPPLQLS